MVSLCRYVSTHFISLAQGGKRAPTCEKSQVLRWAPASGTASSRHYGAARIRQPRDRTAEGALEGSARPYEVFATVGRHMADHILKVLNFFLNQYTRTDATMMLMKPKFVMVGRTYIQTCWYVLRSLTSTLEWNQLRQSGFHSFLTATYVLRPDSVEALAPKKYASIAVTFPKG